MKKLTAFIISLLVIISINCTVFAGMADWDDKSADEAANKQLQEQKNELTGIEAKSTNNYLDSLNIKINGDTLKLEFDKQTVNYDIGEIDESTIEIIASAEDEKATVNGAGTIELNEGVNDIRVDVIAESGTTRTYHINATHKTAKSDEKISNTENTIQNNVIESQNTEVKSNVEETQGSNLKSNNIKPAIGIIIVILFAIIVIRAIKNK